MNGLTFVPHTNWQDLDSGTVIKTKEIPCLTGKGNPTTATIGAVGCWYMDTDSGAVYKCTAAANGLYTWVDVLDSTELQQIVDAYLEANPPAGGDDGGHYIPVVTQPAVETIQFAFTPSKESMPAVTPVTVTLPSGGQDSAQNPVDPEDIAAAVEDYMAENPVSADVGDGSVSRTKLADDLEPFVGTGDSREAPNQYGYGWYYDHTRRTAANILGEMYRTKLANELADADTIVLEQEGDALAHNICIAEDYANNRIYAVYAVSTDSTDNAGSVNCYVRLSVITNPYTKATSTVEHYKVSGNGQYGDLNIVSGTSDANVYVDTNGMVHIWFNATDVSGVWKIAHCTFNPDTGTFADYEWCTLTVGGGEATQLTGDALTSIDDPSITYQKGASLQMNGKYCVVDGYIYAGNVCSEVTRNGIILRSPATNCKDWEFVCCPRWQHESHGKCEMSIGDASVYNSVLFIALRQKYQTGASVNERASAPLLVAQADREFNILQEWLVPDCAARPWWIGQSTLIHNPESRHSANVVAIGNNAWPISFERIGYANYLAGFVSNSGWGNRLVLAGTNGVGRGSKVGISILTDTKLIINSYGSQKTSEAAAIEYFKDIGGVTNKALTFTGAVSATYDGTEAVTVNIPQASSGVVIDATLTQSGQAADAKAVGDALAGKVGGIGITTIMAITQEDYDELVMLGEVSSTTLYIITASAGGGDAEVTMVPYLVSDGTAYIDTGYKCTAEDVLELTYRDIGSPDNGEYISAGAPYCGSDSFFIGYAGGGYIQATHAAVYLAHKPTDLGAKATIKRDPTTLYYDGESVATSEAGTRAAQLSTLIFAKGVSSTVIQKCAHKVYFYGLKIWRGDTLVHYYKPAQEESGVACVYDAVTKEYFYNAAAEGLLTYGEEVEGS